MKICFLVADSNGAFPVPAAKGGAVSTLVEQLIEENSKNKFADLTVISFYNNKAKQIAKKYKNVEFIWIKVPNKYKFLDKTLYKMVKKFFKNKKAISYKSIFSLLFYIKKSSKYLKRKKFDKLILENNIPLVWTIYLSRYSGEFFYHFHNLPRTTAKAEEILKKCTGFLCVSNYISKQLINGNTPLGKIDRNKVHTLYNCVDTKMFYPMQNRKKYRKEIKGKYKIPVDNKIILFVGRISPEKGLNIVLDAINKMKVSNFKLLVIGSVMHGNNEKDAYFSKLVYNFEKLKDKIIFTGYVSHSQLPLFYNAADLVILPSMWEEPAGLTMVESLACGTQLITTDSGGIPEYVKDKGIILKRDKDLVEKIAEISDSLLEKTYENKMSNFEYVQKYFSPHNYLKNFIKILGE